MTDNFDWKSAIFGVVLFASGLSAFIIYNASHKGLLDQNEIYISVSVLFGFLVVLPITLVFGTRMILKLLSKIWIMIPSPYQKIIIGIVCLIMAAKTGFLTLAFMAVPFVLTAVVKIGLFFFLAFILASVFDSFRRECRCPNQE